VSDIFLARSVWSGLSGECLDELAAIEVFEDIPSTQIVAQSRSMSGLLVLRYNKVQDRDDKGVFGGQQEVSWRYLGGDGLLFLMSLLGC